MAFAGLSAARLARLQPMITELFNQSLAGKICTQMPVKVQSGKLPILPMKLLLPNSQEQLPLEGIGNNSATPGGRTEATERNFMCARRAHKEQYSEADSLDELWAQTKSELIPKCVRVVTHGLDRLLIDVMQGNGADGNDHSRALTTTNLTHEWDDTANSTPLTAMRSAQRQTGGDFAFFSTDVFDALSVHPDFLLNGESSVGEETLIRRLMGRIPGLQEVMIGNRLYQSGSPEFAANVSVQFSEVAYIGQKANLILPVFGQISPDEFEDRDKAASFVRATGYQDIVTGDPAAGVAFTNLIT